MQKTLLLGRVVFCALLVVTMGKSNLQAEFIQGVKAVEETLPWFDSEKRYEVYDDDLMENRPNGTVAVTSFERRRMVEPLHLLLSRTIYPAEDGYLDVIVQFDSAPGQVVEGSLIVKMKDSQGREIGSGKIDPIQGDQLFFSCAYPASLEGNGGSLEVVWSRGSGEVKKEASFRVLPKENHPKSGKVLIQLPNPLSVTVKGLPQTLGVPFARGVLNDTRNLRLLDDQGQEVPIQVRETARWSRYGSIRWVLVDFVTDLNGKERHFNLEYGPEIHRKELPAIQVTANGTGIPEVDAGWLRISKQGVFLKEGGKEQQVLPAKALLGAFVDKLEQVYPVDWGHRFVASEDTEYTIPEGVVFEVEQLGPEKVVLKISGDYLRDGQGDPFCQYLVRYVIFRDSPLIRIFHTWVFTGDGNKDRIRNMGWRIPFAADYKPLGFLSGFSENSEWLEGYYLRQEDHNKYTLFAYEEPARSKRIAEWMTSSRPIREIGTGERAPGVMAAQGDGLRVFFGVKDFWQNFPNSLMQTGEGMTFYQWPRYGAPRRHPVSEEKMGEVWRLWFAHEGEVLSFRLPMELTEGPLYVAESGPEPHIDYGRPESVNAQGVAKTAEMWLYITADSTPVEESVKVLEGLNEEQLRAFVDPNWMAGSGAFYELHAKDTEKYEDLEKLYEESVQSPLRLVERMGIYGKWIYGDLLRPADLDQQTSGLYRTFRKSHWGWPYSWIQYIRSGDNRFYKFAEAATRMLTDVAFCHYVGDDVRQQMESLPGRRLWITKQPFREIGWHNRNLIPWGGYWGPSSRMYVDKADYLWHAWLVTGYDRARDVAMKWAEQTKIEMPDKVGRGPITATPNRARWPVNLQKQYMEMYEMTFDPWFLSAAHALSDFHQYRWKEEGWRGHPWATGPREFQRYSGDEAHREFFLANAKNFADWHNLGWATVPMTLTPHLIYAWYITGDDLYLRRVAGILDASRWMSYDAEDPEWYKGWHVWGVNEQNLLFAGWFQQYFPLMLELFERAGGIPENYIPLAYPQRFGGGDYILVQKQSTEALEVRLPGGGRILNAAGEVIVEGKDVSEIPAGTPPGLYRVEPAAKQLMVPITPPGTPEVLCIGKSRRVQYAQHYGQHWFYVPEGVRSFSMEFINTEPERQFLRQVKIWSPSGEEKWSFHQRVVDRNPEEKIIAEIEVPEGSHGLWRVTQGGWLSMPFVLDRQLPAVVTHSPDRWIPLQK